MTSAQRVALYDLARQKHPVFSGQLLASSQMLQRLERLGYVHVDRIADNCFKYSITQSGRDVLDGQRSLDI